MKNKFLQKVKTRLEAGTNGNTAYTYYRGLLQFGFADKPDLDTIVTKTAEWRLGGISNATIAQRYAAVKWLFKQFPREFDPLDVQEMTTFMSGIKADEHEMVYATREQAEAIIKRSSAREALAIGLAYYAGLRLGEIVRVKINHFKFDRETKRLSLIVPSEVGARTKTGRERRIPVMPQLETLLKAYLKGDRARRVEKLQTPPKELLLTDRGAPKGISWRRLQQSIVDACRAVGFDQLSPHSFRHGLATILARETGNVKVVQTVLGHKNVGTTMRYIHITQTEIADSMGGVFN